MADIIDYSRSFMLEKAGELKNSANTIKTVTEELRSEIIKMKASWEGAAAEKYVNKFNGLNDDFQERYDVINQYAQFLIEAADEMDAAERKTESLEDNLA